MQKYLEKQFQSFFAIFRTLELVWIVKKEASSFNRYIYSVSNFHLEKFEGVIFHLQFLTFTRKCKK